MRTVLSNRKSRPPRTGPSGTPRLVNVALVAVLALLVPATRIAAQMEFKGRVASLYTDERLFKPGDVITVLVDERVNGVNNARFRSQRGTDVQANFGSGPSKVFGLLNPFNGTASSKNDFDSRVQNNKTSSFTTEISARVVRTDELGNLYIEGSKVVDMPDEKRMVTISGIARSLDITTENTITSAQLADLRVGMKGKGEAEDARRPTIFNRILGWFF
jgi:flagellar L-ring protein FlgH